MNPNKNPNQPRCKSPTVPPFIPRAVQLQANAAQRQTPTQSPQCQAEPEFKTPPIPVSRQTPAPSPQGQTEQRTPQPWLTHPRIRFVPWNQQQITDHPFLTRLPEPYPRGASFIMPPTPLEVLTQSQITGVRPSEKGCYKFVPPHTFGNFLPHLPKNEKIVRFKPVLVPWSVTQLIQWPFLRQMEIKDGLEITPPAMTCREYCYLSPAERRNLYLDEDSEAVLKGSSRLIPSTSSQSSRSPAQTVDRLTTYDEFRSGMPGMSTPLNAETNGREQEFSPRRRRYSDDEEEERRGEIRPFEDTYNSQEEDEDEEDSRGRGSKRPRISTP